jgi:hypothetical protein
VKPDLDPLRLDVYPGTLSPISQDSTAHITNLNNVESPTNPKNDPELPALTPRILDASSILLMSMHNYIQSQRIDQKAKLKSGIPIAGEVDST